MGDKDIKIFLSGVSAEFRAEREALAKSLRKKYQVKEQSDFDTGSGTLLQKLEGYIRDECQACIFLVGDRFGAEPPPAEAAPHLDPGEKARYSYSHWEYIFATRHHKARYVFMAGQGSEAGHALESDEPAFQALQKPSPKSTSLTRERTIRFSTASKTSRIRSTPSISKPWPTRPVTMSNSIRRTRTLVSAGLRSGSITVFTGETALLPNSTLSPTSDVMVEISDAIVAIGGGVVVRDECTAAQKRGFRIQFFPAEMNHENGRKKGLTEFAGAAATLFPDS